MAKINANEMNALVREMAINAVGLASTDGVTQIDDNAYVIAVETEEGTRYAKFTVTACLAKDTKVNKAFDLDTAVEAYEFKKNEREMKALNRARAKAENEAARAAKAAAKAAKAETKAD